MYAQGNPKNILPPDPKTSATINEIITKLESSSTSTQKFDVDEFHIPDGLDLSDSEYELLDYIGNQLKKKLVADLQEQGYNIISPRRSKINLRRVGIDDIRIDYDEESDRVIFGKLIRTIDYVSVYTYMYDAINPIRAFDKPIKMFTLNRKVFELNDPKEINAAVTEIIAGLSLNKSESSIKKQPPVVFQTPTHSTQTDNSLDTYVVLVGIDRYQTQKTLRYSVKDAYAMYQYFTSIDGAALPNKQIELMTDFNATKANVMSKATQHFSKADENDMSIFYFSGHGLEGGLIPQNYESERDLISYEQIHDMFDKCKAKHKLLIIDACYAGSYEKDIVSNNYLSELAKSKGGFAALFSSNGYQKARQTDDLQASVFTFYLLEGLQGKADKNNNRIITISELDKYASKNTLEYTNYEQETQFTFDKGLKNMPIAEVKK